MAAQAAPATRDGTQRQRAATALGLLGSAVMLAACNTVPNHAPVEDRGASAANHAPAAEAPKPVPAAPAPAPAPGVQTYTVKTGDTLMRIGLDTGQSWRDLARWNNIDNPDRIEVGQVLKVSPPVGDTAVAVTKPVPAPSKVEAHTLPPAGAASGAVATSPAASSAPAAPVNAATAPATAVAREADTELQWAWPAAGPVTTPFDEGKNKGVNIAGKPGDPVLAAADGQVVYAGSGLYGYGNLVIVKHNATYLTAYAFNRVLLVKEDQLVKKGQKIAEMGSTGTDRTQLHFEVRKLGKPIDPTNLLPPR
jgi:lipoprotein NlpD